MKIEKKEIRNNKKMQFFLKLVLSLSAFFFTFLLSNGLGVIYILLGCFISFLIATVIIFKTTILEKINIKRLLFSNIIGLYVVKILLLFCDGNAISIRNNIVDMFSIDLDISYIKILLGLGALPFVIFGVYSLIMVGKEPLKRFLTSLTRVEKRYLLIVFIVSGIFAVLVSLTTSAFSIPTFNDSVVNYDVVYTSDSGFIVNYDSYLNVSNYENDIRQPLFGIFAFPFALIAKFVSEFCFFLPNSMGYAISLTVIQFFLTTISTIMLGKLLSLEEKNKKYFYMLFSFSFPYIVFNLVLEQYVMGLFYLILAIYMYYQNKGKINYMYIGAVGTLITSGVIFPLITKFENFYDWVKKCFKCFCAFVGILVMGGQLSQVFLWKNRFESLIGSYAGSVTLYDKLCQFTHFIEGLFFSEHGAIHYLNGYPSYQLLDFSTISVIGCVIFLLVIVGFIKNRKNKMAVISFCWILFSVFVLFIMGWGTQENGLILYSLYFAWAYFILIFLLIRDLFKNKKFFIIIISSLFILMLICNLRELGELLRFAWQYY